MKKLIRVHNQSTSKYRLFPQGIELLKDCEDNPQMYDLVVNYYENEVYINEHTGVITDHNDREVFDPKFPDSFEFGDYYYIIKDIDSNQFTTK